MPVYDCRPRPEPGARRFPCSVRVIDPATGARIPHVFFLDTAPARLGRFVVGADGAPLACRRRKKLVDTGGGGFRIDTEYDRLEVWEFRPWAAVALDTGELVAKSEGCP